MYIHSHGVRSVLLHVGFLLHYCVYIYNLQYLFLQTSYMYVYVPFILCVFQQVSYRFSCIIICPTFDITKAHTPPTASNVISDLLLYITAGKPQPTSSSVSTSSPVPPSAPSHDQPSTHTLGRNNHDTCISILGLL